MVDKLDVQLLALGYSCDKFALELIESTKAAYYREPSRWVFNCLAHYYTNPAIKTIPTKNMVAEFVEGDEGKLEFFSKIRALQVDPDEFSWLLDKIKYRYNAIVQQDAIKKFAEIKKNGYGKTEVELINNLFKEAATEADTIHRKVIYKEGTLAESADQRLQHYEAVESNPEIAQGVLTGFSTFDRITNGIHKGEFMIVAANTGCQPAGSKVLMGDGRWKNIKDVVPGDKVLSPNGKGGVNVESVYDTIKVEDQKIYEVHSKSKSKQKRSYLASEDHVIPFVRYECSCNKYTGGSIFNMSIKDYNKKSNWWKRTCKIFTAPGYDLPKRDFEIEPYAVGVILGDGSTCRQPNVVSADPIIFSELERAGIELGPERQKKNNKAKHRDIVKESAKTVKRVIGCDGSHTKKIPDEYMLGSLEQRLELLAGLIDTDGDRRSFSTVSRQLAEDFKNLVYSVGGYASLKDRFTKCNNKKFKSYRVNFSFAENRPNTRLARKYIKERNVEWKNPRNTAFKVEYKYTGTVYGIRITGDTQWYITDDYMVTHNCGKSILMHNIAVNALIGPNDPFAPPDTWDAEKGKNVLYFSLEMPKEDQERRISSCIGGIHSNLIRDGKLDSEGKARYIRALRFQRDYSKSIYIVDMPKGVTTRDIEIKFMEVKEKGFDPDLVVVDYMGIMQPQNPVGVDWQDLGKVSQELHEFTRAYQNRLLTASQVNRTPDGKESYSTSRIARSGMVPDNANIIIQIANRPDEEIRDDMLVYITKMRDGEKGHFTLLKDFGRMKVMDIVDDDSLDGEDLL